MEINHLLHPKSIAVVGASSDTTKIGSQILHNLIQGDYKGDLFAVNNKETHLIHGLKPYSNLTEIPETVEMAIIAIPAQFVETIIDDAIQKKLKSLVIISAGFRETGPEGKKSEQRISEKCSKNGITVLGPNCLGLINTHHHMNASFAKGMPQKGNIAFISQSGAFATAFFDWASSHNLGISHMVSLGNKAQISENDFLKNLPDKTKVISLYLEEFSDGLEFISLSQQINKEIPIIAITPGNNTETQKAVQSHTGSMTSDAKVVKAALQQAGIIQTETISKFFNLNMAFSMNQHILKGNHIAIITNAGGPGIIATDALSNNHLSLAQFSPETEQKLTQILPRSANFHDPVDILGDAQSQRYTDALNILGQESHVDAILVLLTPQTSTEIKKTAEKISQLAKIIDKPIFASFIGGQLVHEGIEILTKHDIPTYEYPEDALYCLGKMSQYFGDIYRNTAPHAQKTQTIHKSPETQNIIQQAKHAQKEVLSFTENIKLVENSGMTVAPWKIVNTIEETWNTALQLGTPVVLKIDSNKILHKTEHKGVITGITNKRDLFDAYQQLQHTAEYAMLAAEDYHIVLQKQILNGIECILGAKQTPSFGPVITFGMGGTQTEIFSDTALFLPTQVKSQILKSIEKTKVYTLLKGYRNEPPMALDKLIHTIIYFSNLLSFSEINEIEINPLIATEDDVYAVDIRTLLKFANTPN